MLVSNRYVVHHSAILLIWSSMLLGDFGHVFAVVAMSCEATQPFIGLNFYMEK